MSNGRYVTIRRLKRRRGSAFAHIINVSGNAPLLAIVMSSLIEQQVEDGPPVLQTIAAAKNGASAIEVAHETIATRYRALAWLTGATCLAYLCRNAVGVPESTIREELGLTLPQSG